MLIDEEFYQNLILKFVQIGRLSWIVIYYSRIIRWILRKAYHIVLKSYMALSREMEFHADEVSANIGGSFPAISALLRLSLAGDSFHYVWQFYHRNISENLKTENIFPQHKFVMNLIAEKSKLNFVNGLPQVTKELLSSFNRSKLVIQNQWASHPLISDRVKRLEQLNIDSNVSHESAWNFFMNADDLQKNITEKLFKNWQFSETPVNIEQKDFELRYTADVQKNSYDERYSYFYEYRDISRFDLNELLKSDENIVNDFEQLYSENNLKLIFEFTGLTSDIKTIDSISRGEFDIDIYEYDGVKYKSKQSDELGKSLVKVHKEMYKNIVELDKNIFRFFYSKAKILGKEQELTAKYQTYFYLVEEDKNNLKIYLDLVNAIQFIYRVHSFSQIGIKMYEMKLKENIFRDQIKKMLDDENYKESLSDNRREKFQNYVNNNLIYFRDNKYDQEALKILEETIYQFYEVCSSAPFYSLKNLLDFQIEILDSQYLK